MALAALGQIHSPGRHQREGDFPAQARERAGFLQEAGFHGARVGVDEGCGRGSARGFFHGEVVHAYGVQGGVAQGEVLAEVEVG